MFLVVENLMEITRRSSSADSIRIMNQLFGVGVIPDVMDSRVVKLSVHCTGGMGQVCDKWAEEFAVEKVKTIQDKYMCVSGAPDQREDHAQAMVRLMMLPIAMLDLRMLWNNECRQYACFTPVHLIC